MAGQESTQIIAITTIVHETENPTNALAQLDEGSSKK